MKGLLASACLLLLTAAAGAETRYVQDQLEITLRTGESTRHSIVRMLSSGTRLELLESNPDTGYSLVRTQEGAEGWVLTRLLMTEPSARQQLASVRVQAATLREEQGRLETELSALRGQNEELKRQLADMEQRYRQTARDLDEIRSAASNVLAVNENNKVLSQQISDVQQELDAARAESEAMRRDSRQRWFMTGGGVAFAGLLLGLLIPRLRWRRRSRWGSL